MFCPICCQRWAPLDFDIFEERFDAFESNEVKVCGDPDCEKNVLAYTENSEGNLYSEQVKKVEEYLAKHPTAKKMEE